MYRKMRFHSKFPYLDSDYDYEALLGTSSKNHP